MITIIHAAPPIAEENAKVEGWSLTFTLTCTGINKLHICTVVN
jgi:hypothetical protein